MKAAPGRIGQRSAECCSNLWLRSPRVTKAQPMRLRPNPFYVRVRDGRSEGGGRRAPPPCLAIDARTSSLQRLGGRRGLNACRNAGNFILPFPLSPPPVPQVSVASFLLGGAMELFMIKTGFYEKWAGGKGGLK